MTIYAEFFKINLPPKEENAIDENGSSLRSKKASKEWDVSIKLEAVQDIIFEQPTLCQQESRLFGPKIICNKHQNEKDGD